MYVAPRCFHKEDAAVCRAEEVGEAQRGVLDFVDRAFDGEVAFDGLAREAARGLVFSVIHVLTRQQIDEVLWQHLGCRDREVGDVDRLDGNCQRPLWRKVAACRGECDIAFAVRYGQRL